MTEARWGAFAGVLVALASFDCGDRSSQSTAGSGSAAASVVAGQTGATTSAAPRGSASSGSATASEGGQGRPHSGGFFDLRPSVPPDIEKWLGLELDLDMPYAPLPTGGASTPLPADARLELPPKGIEGWSLVQRVPRGSEATPAPLAIKLRKFTKGPSDDPATKCLTMAEARERAGKVRTVFDTSWDMHISGPCRRGAQLFLFEKGGQYGFWARIAFRGPRVPTDENDAFSGACCGVGAPGDAESLTATVDEVTAKEWVRICLGVARRCQED